LFYNESIFSFLSCFREYYYRFVTIRDNVSGLPPICTLVGTPVWRGFERGGWAYGRGKSNFWFWIQVGLSRRYHDSPVMSRGPKRKFTKCYKNVQNCNKTWVDKRKTWQRI